MVAVVLLVAVGKEDSVMVCGTVGCETLVGVWKGLLEANAM